MAVGKQLSRAWIAPGQASVGMARRRRNGGVFSGILVGLSSNSLDRHDFSRQPRVKSRRRRSDQAGGDPVSESVGKRGVHNMGVLGADILGSTRYGCPRCFQAIANSGSNPARVYESNGSRRRAACLYQASVVIKNSTPLST